MVKSMGLLAMTAVLAGCVAVGGTIVTTGSKSAHLGCVRHIVLLKFKDGATSDEVRAIENAFRALPGKIDAIESFEWGTDISPENLAQGFTHCFLLTFRTEAARDAYLTHPAHKEFGALLGPHLDKVLVIDFKARD